jgi:hypothetical protein
VPIGVGVVDGCHHGVAGVERVVVRLLMHR